MKRVFIVWDLIGRIYSCYWWPQD